MGYYIEVPQSKRKAQQIFDLYDDARLEDGPIAPTKERVGICVVSNPMFDAAAIIFSVDEGEAFNQPDDYRPKTWMSLPYETVIKLNPYVKEAIRV